MNKFLNPKKYWNRASDLLHGVFYDLEKIRSLERTKFDALGLDYDAGLKKLDQVLAGLGKPPYGLQDGIASVHWILFACLSLKSTVRNILEIGTYDGETALVLSRLFPESRITTFDLPENDPIFTSSYHRESDEVRDRFKAEQAKNTSDPRITLVQRNSFFLPDAVKEKFDLIWIDGGHHYPEAAWDICNAYHLCAAGGWILCDDVLPHPKAFRDDYVSNDSFKTLEYARLRTGENVTYFLKRESPRWSANPRKRKFVSLWRKA